MACDPQTWLALDGTESRLTTYNLWETKKAKGVNFGLLRHTVTDRPPSHRTQGSRVADRPDDPFYGPKELIRLTNSCSKAEPSLST